MSQGDKSVRKPFAAWLRGKIEYHRDSFTPEDARQAAAVLAVLAIPKGNWNPNETPAEREERLGKVRAFVDALNPEASRSHAQDKLSTGGAACQHEAHVGSESVIGAGSGASRPAAAHPSTLSTTPQKPGEDRIDFDLEEYIAGLQWTDQATDHEKTLVIGNLRGMFAVIRERHNALAKMALGLADSVLQTTPSATPQKPGNPDLTDDEIEDLQPAVIKLLKEAALKYPCMDDAEFLNQVDCLFVMARRTLSAMRTCTFTIPCEPRVAEPCEPDVHPSAGGGRICRTCAGFGVDGQPLRCVRTGKNADENNRADRTTA